MPRLILPHKLLPCRPLPFDSDLHGLKDFSFEHKTWLSARILEVMREANDRESRFENAFRANPHQPNFVPLASFIPFVVHYVGQSCQEQTEDPERPEDRLQPNKTQSFCMGCAECLLICFIAAFLVYAAPALFVLVSVVYIAVLIIAACIDLLLFWLYRHEITHDEELWVAEVINKNQHLTKAAIETYLREEFQKIADELTCNARMPFHVVEGEISWKQKRSKKHDIIHTRKTLEIRSGPDPNTQLPAVVPQVREIYRTVRYYLTQSCH